MTTEIRSNLAKAAQLIRERGWWRGPNAFGPNGEMCSLAAIRRASQEDYTGPTATYFRKQIGGGSIVAWNDRQTAESVLAMLDRLSTEAP